MLMNEKERRRSLVASAAITIALLVPAIRLVTGPASLGRVAGVSVPSGEGAQTAATNKAPTVGGKTAPAMKTPWGGPDLQGIWARDVGRTRPRPTRDGGRALLPAEARAELG